MSILGDALTRRAALKTALAAAAGLALPHFARADYDYCDYGRDDDPPAGGVTDEDVFNFALNLESLEAEYYLRGTTGQGLSDSDGGDNPGRVNGGRMVSWKDENLHQLMTEIAMNELAHVRLYRHVLGPLAVDKPEIDIAGGFAGAAKAAGLGDNFDPFASEMNFLLGGMLMEDVGVTAYNGAINVLKKPSNRQSAAGILAVEAYHMGMARSWLYNMGSEARAAANAISDARDKVDGDGDKDQGIEVGGKANFVPSDPEARAFTRTPQEVLNIVYLKPGPGVTQGGMFPRGMNGKIRTS